MGAIAPVAPALTAVLFIFGNIILLRDNTLSTLLKHPYCVHMIFKLKSYYPNLLGDASETYYHDGAAIVVLEC